MGPNQAQKIRSAEHVHQEIEIPATCASEAMVEILPNNARRHMSPDLSTIPNFQISKTAIPRRRGIQPLLKDEPSLGSAREIFTSLGQISGLIENTSTLPEQSTMDVLSVGAALDQTGGAKEDVVSVLALAKGLSKSVLFMTLLTHSTLPSLTSPGADRNLLVPAASICGTWEHPLGGSILQIASVEGPNRHKAYMAVRSTVGITFFQPALRVTAKKGREKNRIQPSQHTLDLSPLPFDESGMAKHTSYNDLSFNPWKPEQIALLGANGQLRIATIKESSRFGLAVSSIGSTSLICHTSLMEDSLSWGRVVWVGNSSTVAICSAKELTMYTIFPMSRRLKTPQLQLRHSEDRFLELRRDQSRPGLIYALTTREVFCIRITRELRAGWKESRIGRPCVELVWKHFRNPGSVSLSVALPFAPSIATDQSQLVLELHDAPATVLVYNKDSAVVTAHNVVFDGSQLNLLSFTKPISIQLYNAHTSCSDQLGASLMVLTHAITTDLQPASDSAIQALRLLQIFRLDVRERLHHLWITLPRQTPRSRIARSNMDQEEEIIRPNSSQSGRPNISGTSNHISTAIVLDSPGCFDTKATRSASDLILRSNSPFKWVLDNISMLDAENTTQSSLKKQLAGLHTEDRPETERHRTVYSL